MAYQYNYAAEKFSRAIYTLATSTGDVRSRLISVFKDELLFINLDNLLMHLRSDYQWVLKQITKYHDKYFVQRTLFELYGEASVGALPTRIRSTLFRIKNVTGTRIAVKIFSIWSVLDEETRL